MQTNSSDILTWTNLAAIPADHLFMSGAMFRRMNVGTNRPHPEEDYYDYMLLQLEWAQEQMLVVNITAQNIKAGYVPCAIDILPHHGTSVTAQSVRHVLGQEHIYADMWNN